MFGLITVAGCTAQQKSPSLLGMAETGTNSSRTGAAAASSTSGDPASSTSGAPAPTTSATEPTTTTTAVAASGGGSGTKQIVMRRFVSTDLTVPAVTAWRSGELSPGLLFVGQKVKTYNGLIMDNHGEPVWIEPTGVNLTDLRVQSYNGKPVLTYWTGKQVKGHGYGVGKILDTTYSTVATVKAGNGLQNDLHEFHLTSDGTALITAYTVKQTDLTSVGGPKKGYIFDCHAQEVDIRTGKVLLDWSALDHVGLDESYMGIHDRPDQDGTSADKAYDVYHMNAIDDVGDYLLISFRYTHSIFAIDRKSGDVLWRFGGKKSDFSIPADAQFAWQHDVRHDGSGGLTIFDNHLLTTTQGGHSSGKHFALDMATKKATLVAQYAYDQHLGFATGSNQPMPNGNTLIGWGTDPSITEFDRHGKPIYQAKLGGESYRTARCEWTATPASKPLIAAKADGGTPNVTVYMSWNGATEVAEWRIKSGDSSSTLTEVARTPRSGFETKLTIPSAKVVAADALDAAGNVLASTKTTKV